jgi:quinolinate synthase
LIADADLGVAVGPATGFARPGACCYAWCMATVTGPMQRSFPSLVIRADRLEPRGAFAEAQARYLNPDPALVGRLESLLREKNLGVVAHFYMDPELQGVLAACRWPHIHIADSLEMAGRSVEMVQAGVKAMVVLGVDFMSENVRAMVGTAGFGHVPVYRVRDEPIDCTLALAARSPEYAEYLREASAAPRSLHVIYVNTGLDVKARAHSLLPTITCTSSNVVRLVLQAAAQVPDVELWYGPDSYMGENLRCLFTSLLDMDPGAIGALHPEHDRASVERLVARLHHFRHGICIVHHSFGDRVVELVRRDHPDAMIAAHLEVPGEMFQSALEGQQRGAGVVGSTANILSFISGKVQAAVQSREPRYLKFVLGTEPGMVTSIVRRIRSLLENGPEGGRTDMAAEIIFPVAADAVAACPDDPLRVVPGVPQGEGCSTAGGCSICPYMKMNSLAALFEVLNRIGSAESGELKGFEPRTYSELIGGRTVAELGGQTILYMRAFQQAGRLPDALVQDIRTRRC